MVAVLLYADGSDSLRKKNNMNRFKKNCSFQQNDIFEFCSLNQFSIFQFEKLGGIEIIHTPMDAIYLNFFWKL